MKEYVRGYRLGAACVGEGSRARIATSDWKIRKTDRQIGERKFWASGLVTWLELYLAEC